MKNNRTIFSLIFIALLFVSSCDIIEAPFVDPNQNEFTCDYNSNLPTRKVLIEDFTGYQCVNCPRAAAELHALLEEYSCHVIPVAIHYGFFAEPFTLGDPDYRAPEGQEIGVFFEITESLPIGMVNRKQVNGSYEISSEDWASNLINILSINHFADVEIISSNSFSGNELSYNIEVNEINTLGINYSLVVMLTEDGIIGPQKDGSLVVQDYEHNHMLRAGLIGSNTTWGIPVSLPHSGDYTYTWPEGSGWMPENCHLVIYVYNTDTKEVIQAEQFPLVVNE